jgi:hypothetical protein
VNSVFSDCSPTDDEERNRHADPSNDGKNGFSDVLDKEPVLTRIRIITVIIVSL